MLKNILVKSKNKSSDHRDQYATSQGKKEEMQGERSNDLSYILGITFFSWSNSNAWTRSIQKYTENRAGQFR